LKESCPKSFLMISLGSQLMEDKQVVTKEDKVSNGMEQLIETLDPQEAQLVQEMMDLGVFYGGSKSRTNPKMKPYILSNRSGFGVINLRKTYSALKKTGALIEDAISKQGLVMFVGTSPSVKTAIKDSAIELDIPHVVERWLGGTLTNFETISKRIKYLKKLKADKASGELDKYTKKEKLELERELAKLERLFGGIENLDRLPTLVFIADLKNNEIAAKEAREIGATVVGVVNTDSDPTLVDRIIPANDRNKKAMDFIINRVKEMVLEAKAKMPIVKEEPKIQKEKISLVNKTKEKKIE